MKLYQYIRSLILAFVALSLSACFNDEYLLQTEGENVSITFRPTLGGELGTRAIGDATGIDRLTVAVYEGSQSLSKKFYVSKDWDTVNENGIELTLIEGRSYKILFWAENSGNSAYIISDDGRIEVNYGNYINGGFAKMEEMDVFFGTSSITVGTQKVENKEIKLSRPLAQLNFADNATQPERGTHKAVVTFHGIATAFNPFTGEVEMSNTDKTFVFTDFPTETMSIDGSTYYYLSSNYLFAPQTGTVDISATIDLQNTDGTSIKTIELSGITLEKNKKTNVTGSIIQQPETWSVWDGESKTLPEPDAQNRYIVDEAADIAWLCENGATLRKNSIFLQTKDIDMASKAIASIKLPAGSTYDGGGKTIKNYANSLFGDATALTVKDLAVENITVSGSNHIGTLVNTLKGSSSFKNVSVSNGTVSTTNGAAGGMVGYIVRTTEKDRSETLNVSFASCKLNGVSVSGSASEGKFVGLLSGYDNSEALSFDTECEATDVSVADYTSVYTKANNSAWVTGELTDKYDGWLGHETYRRAKVTFGGVRLAPRGDGVNKITPLTDGSTKLIYSAFDLASLQGSSHTAVTFKSDVDLGGDGKDKNLFTPISSVDKLDGENHKLYNLNIFYKSWIVGFINGTSIDNTEHKNLHFVNSSVRANMTGSESQVYVGSLCPYVQKKYTVNNITVTNGYVLGLGKLGGLIGYVTPESSSYLTCNNCIVTSSKIENIKGTVEETFIVVKYYPHGEVGGLVGFIQNGAKISNCKVVDCTIHCFGQDDKLYFIPGRHVNDFIGDIRLDGGQRVDLINNTVSNNKFTNRKKDTHSSKCPIVGKCYKISGTAGTVYIGSTKVF